MGLTVTINPHFRKTTTYSPKEGVVKEVVYFLAPVTEGAITVQEEEVRQFAWLSYDQALDRLSYPNDQALLREAEAYLKSLN